MREKSMEIIETPTTKVVSSENYNFVFHKRSGFFASGEKQKMKTLSLHRLPKFWISRLQQNVMAQTESFVHFVINQTIHHSTEPWKQAVPHLY
jgi:hypothetical protein